MEEKRPDTAESMSGSTTQVDRSPVAAAAPNGDEGARARKARSDEPADMQQLLDQADDLREVRRGEVVEGTIMRIDEDGVLINVGAKSEGVIPFREMRTLSQHEIDSLRVGDDVIAYVLRTDDGGQALLSFDRARGERAWKVLQEHLDAGTAIGAKVIGYNRGGLLVGIEGVQGFVPLSQLSPQRRANSDDEQEKALSTLLNVTLQLKVIELNRRRRRAILSERAALHALKDSQKEKLLEALKEGEVRKGTVTGIQDFGVFVDLGGADGLIHISELAWTPVASPSEVVHEGQDVDVYVMKVDPETKRISLSLRRAHGDPWANIAQRYQTDQIVQGTITRLTAFGAFAKIEDNIEGLIHISELADHRIRHPREVVREGDVVSLKVLRVEADRRRLGLSLRQAASDPG